MVSAHDTALAAIALNPSGNRLATASQKGTLLRLFDTSSGKKVGEFRRGTDECRILSLAFSPNSHWLCVSSDKGTVHVFALDPNVGGYPLPEGMSQEAGATATHNQTSSFVPSFVKAYMPEYFSSVWSFAHFRLPQDTESVCAFGTDDPHTLLSMFSAFHFLHVGPVLTLSLFPKFSVRTDHTTKSDLILKPLSDRNANKYNTHGFYPHLKNDKPYNHD